MGLRDIGETLPPGFRFYPNDEELVCHYLYKKIANEEVLRGTLVEIDLHTCEPWQLPDVAKLNSEEWYFFSFRDRKYATGFRTNRATKTGYWKATGKDRAVLDPRTRAVVGMRKTLVFYKNRAPNGIKTEWIMHEFRLENPHVPPKEDWVLCRVFNKSRGENNHRQFSPQSNNSYHDPADGVTSPNLNAPCGYQSIGSFLLGENPSTSLGLSALEQPAGNIPSSNNGHNKMIESATKCDHQDDYGFLFDFDGSNGLVPSGFEVEDLKFGDGDNNLIFMETRSYLD